VRDAVAERWIVDDFDYLELLIRCDTVADTQPAQEELEREVGALNLQQDNNSTSKPSGADPPGRPEASDGLTRQLGCCTNKAG
jgi:hypothetical protein